LAECSILRGFMGDEFATALLNHAIISQVSFVSTRIGEDDCMLGDRTRKSLKHPVSQDYETLIANAVGGGLPQISQELGIRPFPISSYEIELVAHGDGAFTIDTLIPSQEAQISLRRQSSFLRLLHALAAEAILWRSITPLSVTHPPCASAWIYGCCARTRHASCVFVINVTRSEAYSLSSSSHIIGFPLIAGCINKASLPLRRSHNSCVNPWRDDLRMVAAIISA